tara:strand:+ start:192 stop:347 length:156 start_codon:yes stop_codon:yes gene_type:complete
MIYKLLLISLTFVLTSCASVSDKAGKLKPNIGKCPPQSERTLADIACREAK